MQKYATKLTPAMEQYWAIKKRYKDAILLFRMGDFYETFDEDAKIAAKELDIVLTTRGHGDKKVPLAGVPYHAVEHYLSKLVKKGYKVAICEQVEDPRFAKGIVKREVVRLITPGTIIDAPLLDARANNYLAAIFMGQNSIGISFVDASTGDFLTTQFDGDKDTLYDKLRNELVRYMPAECILPTPLFLNKEFVEKLKKFVPSAKICEFDETAFNRSNAYNTLINHFGVLSLEGLGCENLENAIRTSGAAITYLLETQKKALDYITTLTTYSTADHMILDATTVRNLEILRNVRDNSARGTLCELLDKTITPMGGRLFQKILLEPLINVIAINKRLDAVEEFFVNAMLRLEVRQCLKKIADIQRLISRISYGTATPRDVIAFKNTYEHIATLKQITSKSQPKSELIVECHSAIDILEDVIKEIGNTLVDDPPVNPKEGGLIKDGFSAELDNLRATTKHAKEWLAELEFKERIRTGIKSLKVGYTDAFGYYIEVTKTNLKLVPSDYIRKQTLVNCERFITPELKEKEALILGAEERINELEYKIFIELCNKISKHAGKVQKTADAIAKIDVLSAFAEVSAENQYTRPEVNDTNSIFIKDGRHPVVEKALYPVKNFIPNDTMLDTTENRIVILTGPNMAGKSTYLRQVALISIMAQIGCFVPAKYASLGIVDRIFTRVGAFDDLTMGQSTFMIEMVELANILNNATPKSLILLDEIGRGTSTFDGLSIAWAVAEYLHSKSKQGTKTLFATHYHHLTELASTLDGMKNYHIAVKEDKEDIIFLHKVVPGSTDKSYGIQVAKLAGVPKDVVKRAAEVLKMIERQDFALLGDRKKISKPRYTQLILFSDTELGLPTHPVIEELKKTDINNLTPLEALSKLCELKKRCTDEL